MPNKPTRISIACGGTGGHLFPGVAIAQELVERGVAVELIISTKDVDRRAVEGLTGMDIVAIPAVSPARGKLRFGLGLIKSNRVLSKAWKSQKPDAVIAMGGFCCVPPILKAKLSGIPGFLHESNTIPGRANRFIARFCEEVFVWFPEAVQYFKGARHSQTGMPVRASFQPGDKAISRVALDLSPDRPVILVMGGSQGATGINRSFVEGLGTLAKENPELQYIHLTGVEDEEWIQKRYQELNLSSHVRAFSNDMETALSAATLVVARSGASSLAELAATRVPSVLVPYPHAADNHQFYNAGAFVASDAARMMEEPEARSGELVKLVSNLISDSENRARMTRALGGWESPNAAGKIVECVFATIGRKKGISGKIDLEEGANVPEDDTMSLLAEGQHGIAQGSVHQSKLRRMPG